MSALDSLVLRLEAVTAKLSGGGGGGGGGEGPEAGPALSAWNDFRKGSVQAFINAANKIEGTQKIGAWTTTSFDHCGKVIQAAQDCTKPSQPDFMKFADPIVQVITASSNPDSRSATFNQEKAFAEIITGLSWIMMDLTKPFILGQLEASDFYLNKVLTGAKEKADAEKSAMQEFVKTVKQMMTDMAAYAFEYHKTGISWNFKGGKLSEWNGPVVQAAGGGDAGSGKKKFLEERLEDAIKTLEACARSGGARGGGGGGGGGGGDEPVEDPPRVTAYNEFYNAHVQPFIDVCNKMPSTKAIGESTAASFKHMGEVIRASAEYAKPDQGTLMKFLDPVVQIIQKSSNPDSRGASFNEEKSFAEIIQAQSWVMMDLTKPFVIGQLEAAEFYLNKVLTGAKDKADAEKKAAQEYVKTMKTMMNELAVYCAAHFKTGLEWKPKGKPLSELLAKGVGAGSAAASAAKDVAVAAGSAAAAAAKPAIDGLAAALANRPATAPAAGAAAAKPAAKAVVKKEPSIKVTLDKVFIENYGREQKEPVVYKCELVDGKPKQGVFIGNCVGCVIKLEGKAKNITVSGCQDAGLVFDACVTTVEAVNCKKVQIQGIELCGTVLLDKCDRTKVYLPKASVSDGNKALVYTTQSGSTNVFWDSQDADMCEYGVPEQILQKFEIGKPVICNVIIPESTEVVKKL